MSLKFSNEPKVRRQMKDRGWTDQMIEEALKTPVLMPWAKMARRRDTFVPQPDSRWSLTMPPERFFTSVDRGIFMTETIYISLEDEGIAVKRPARAYRRPDGKYIVLRPADYDPSAERWSFPPGSVVECETRDSAEGRIEVAVRRVAEQEATPGKQAV